MQVVEVDHEGLAQYSVNSINSLSGASGFVSI